MAVVRITWVCIMLLFGRSNSQTNSDSLWHASSYIPKSVDELVGIWSFGNWAEGETFDLLANGLFNMRWYSDVATNEGFAIESFTGRYHSHNDTIGFVFLACTFRSTASKELLEAAKDNLDDLLEWRTHKYSLCFVKRVDTHLFLVPSSLKTHFLERVFTAKVNVRTKTGKPYSRFGLMKGEVDMTKPNE